jgi:hypothetical protein
MAEPCSNEKIVDLGVEFNGTIIVNDTQIEISDEGILLVTSDHPEGYRIYSEPCEDNEESPPEIGDVMESRLIHGGLSPETGKQMHILPKELMPAHIGSVQTREHPWMTIKEAVDYAAKIEIQGHVGFRPPTRSEWEAIEANMDKGALKKQFDHATKYGGRWFASCTVKPGNGTSQVWQHKIGDGSRGWFSSDYPAAMLLLRCE